MKKVTGLMTMLALVCASAMGVDAVVLEPHNFADPTDEMNLSEIYNALYGTGYGSVAAMEAAGLRMLPDEVFALLSNTSFDVAARFAGQTQRFGYYTTPGAPTGDFTVGGGGTNGDFNHLFDVAPPNGGLIPSGTITATVNPGASVGFYDNTPIGTSRAWYSESALNGDALDHMVAYWAQPGGGAISTNLFIVAWEDRPYNQSDKDFNDLVVEISTGGFPPPPIPEPSTLALLGLGAAGLFLRRRFWA